MGNNWIYFQDRGTFRSIGLWCTCVRHNARYYTHKPHIIYYENNSWPLRKLRTNNVNFSLTGRVKSKNCVHWSGENSHDVIPMPLHESNVTMWCSISSRSVTFREVISAGIKTCSVTSTMYTVMLENYVIAELCNYRITAATFR